MSRTLYDVKTPHSIPHRENILRAVCRKQYGFGKCQKKKNIQRKGGLWQNVIYTCSTDSLLYSAKCSKEETICQIIRL